MTEEQLQRAVARYLDHHPATKGHWFHTPNGGQRNAIVGAKLKAQGVKKGVPDVLIVKVFYSGYGKRWEDLGKSRMLFSGLAIELKVGKNKTTPEQEAWLDVLADCGWKCRVCRSLDEVMEVVKDCYG